MFLFGGEFPGDDIIPRPYSLHVLLIPGLLLVLIPLHAVVLTWRQTHTQFREKGLNDRLVSGVPFFPAFLARTPRRAPPPRTADHRRRSPPSCSCTEPGR